MADYSTIEDILDNSQNKAIQHIQLPENELAALEALFHNFDFSRPPTQAWCDRLEALGATVFFLKKNSPKALLLKQFRHQFWHKSGWCPPYQTGIQSTILRAIVSTKHQQYLRRQNPEAGNQSGFFVFIENQCVSIDIIYQVYHWLCSKHYPEIYTHAVQTMHQQENRSEAKQKKPLARKKTALPSGGLPGLEQKIKQTMQLKMAIQCDRKALEFLLRVTEVLAEAIPITSSPVALSPVVSNYGTVPVK